MRYADSPSYLLRWLWPRWIVFQAQRLPPTRAAEEIGENYLSNPEAWSEFSAGLDRLAEIARQHGICAHVLLHTRLIDLGPDHPYLPVYERVTRAAIERGLTVTPTFPLVSGHRDPDLWVGPIDPHPNRRAHSLFAEALRTGLASLPAHCLPRSE